MTVDLACRKKEMRKGSTLTPSRQEVTVLVPRGWRGSSERGPYILGCSAQYDLYYLVDCLMPLRTLMGIDLGDTGYSAFQHRLAIPADYILMV